MSICGLVVALCIAVSLLFRARAAALAIVVHAARRGAPRLAIAGLVVLAVGAQAHHDAALDRPPATIADAPSTTITLATPPFTEAFLRAPPPNVCARTRPREALATERGGASLLSSKGRPHQIGHGRRRVRRPGSRVMVKLPVAVVRLSDSTGGTHWYRPWSTRCQEPGGVPPRTPGRRRAISQQALAHLGAR
jgi:hypothetical protein